MLREHALETIDDCAWIADARNHLGTWKELIEQPHVGAPTAAAVKDDIRKAFVVPGENLPKNANALRVRNKLGTFVAIGAHCLNRGFDHITDWRLDRRVEARILRSKAASSVVPLRGKPLMKCIMAYSNSSTDQSSADLVGSSGTQSAPELTGY